MDLKSLKEFLRNSPIKIVEKKPKTFLEIARQPHYENVISSIYAFYFDVYEEHGLTDLFIQSLLDCITETELGQEKTFDSFLDFNIDLEKSTKTGRIDILISTSNSAIIIENKIFHILNNDLNDYWTSVVKGNVKSENSIGIVLSLDKKTDIKHDQFISITHLQLLNKVFENIGKYLLTSTDKYIVFLKDLYQNIHNLTFETMTEEELNTVLEYHEKIKAIIELDNKYREYIKDEILKALTNSEKLIEVKLTKGSKREQSLKYFRLNENSNVVITVNFENVVEPKSKSNLEIYFYIELWGEAIQNYENAVNDGSFNQLDLPNVFLFREKDYYAYLLKSTLKLDKSKIIDFRQALTIEMENNTFIEKLEIIESKLP